MSLGDIIKKYRTEHNLSMQAFADLIKSSKSYVSMLEKNFNPATGKPISPSLETLKLIADAMFIDIDALLKMLDKDQEILLDEKDFKSQFKPHVNAIEVVKVPVLGKISAGVPVLAEESFEGYALAPASQIKHGKEYFYLRVKGDSMNLKCPEGSIVLIEKCETLENGEIGVIAVNGYEATIKKYRKENELVILEPMSTNPNHTVQIYNSKEIEIHILGKAISFQGKL